MSSCWASVPQAPPDAILGVAAAFRADPRPNKVNLSIGAYRDGEGRPYVLEAVRKAEARLVKDQPGHEYLPIGGLEPFQAGARTLAFGKDGENVAHSRIATVQALSGTGSLRIVGEFLRRWYYGKTEKAEDRIIYLPAPTWGNHHKIFADCSLTVRTYRYFDPKTGGVDIAGLLEDIRAAPEHCVVLFHSCAHNPTGADPTRDQWADIHKVCCERGVCVVFDSAYQGFASGDPEADAYSLRLFARGGVDGKGQLPMLLCQSFAKNLGLYGERVGAAHVICADEEEAKRVKSQLETIIRPMYSNPPSWGARLAATVFGDPELMADWAREMKMMSGRIGEMRTKLVEALKKAGSTRDWEFIKKQIGMFSFTGLTKAQCDALIKEYAVYVTGNGRISMAGLNEHNVDYVAQAIHQVTLKY